MIPEFVTEGLTSPTTSLSLISVTILATAVNVEIGHLRRVYNLAATTHCTSGPRADGESRDHIQLIIPPRLPWQYRLAHGVGLFSTGLLSAVCFVAPSVSSCFFIRW